MEWGSACLDMQQNYLNGQKGAALSAFIGSRIGKIA